MSAGRFRERLLERAGRAHLQLPPAMVDQLEAYFLLLSRWNKRINLTALPLDPPSNQALDRMLIEPLVAAQHVKDAARDCFDLGSGGGSPAFPMKIARQASRITLVETRSRKAAFLRAVARELTLSNVTVIADRFETLASRPEVIGSADLVTVRAVKLDRALFGAAHQICRPGGEIFLFGTKGIPTPNSDLFTSSRTVELVPHDESELVIQTRA